MKRTTSVLMLAASILVCLTTLAVVYAQPAGRGKPTAVAVVDIEKVLNGLQEKAAIEAELNTRKQQITEKAKERESEVKELQASLEALSPTGANYRKKQEELEQKVYELQAWQAWQQNNLGREFRLQTAALYRKIQGAVGEMAKAGGYDLVVVKEGNADLSNLKLEDLSQAIRTRKVLYAAPELDVSDQVTTVMNNAYKNNVIPPK